MGCITSGANLVKGTFRLLERVRWFLFLPLFALVYVVRIMLRFIFNVIAAFAYVVKKGAEGSSFLSWLFSSFFSRCTPIFNRITAILEGVTRPLRRWRSQYPILNVILNIPPDLMVIIGKFISGLASFVPSVLMLSVFILPFVIVLGPILQTFEYAPGSAMDTSLAVVRGTEAVANIGIQWWNVVAVIVNPYLPYEWSALSISAKVLYSTFNAFEDAAISAPQGRRLEETIFINGLPHSRNLELFPSLGAADKLGIAYGITAGTLNSFFLPIYSIFLQTLVVIYDVVLRILLFSFGFWAKVARTATSFLVCGAAGPAAVSCIVIEFVADLINTLLIPINQLLPFATFTIPVCGEQGNLIPITTDKVPCECSILSGGPLRGVPSCPGQKWICYAVRVKGDLLYGEYNENNQLDAKTRRDTSVATNIQQGCPNYLRNIGTGRRLEEGEDRETVKCFYSEELNQGWMISDIADTSQLNGGCKITSNGTITPMELSGKQRQLALDQYFRLPHVTPQEKSRFTRSYIPPPKQQKLRHIYSKEEALESIQNVLDERVSSERLGLECEDIEITDKFATHIYKFGCFIRKLHLSAYGENGVTGLLFETSRRLKEDLPIQGPRPRRHLEEVFDIIASDKPYSRKLEETHEVIYAYHKTVNPEAKNVHEYVTALTKLTEAMKKESETHWGKMIKDHHEARNNRIVYHSQRRSLVTVPDSNKIGDFDIGGCGSKGILCADGTCAKDGILENCLAMTNETYSLGGVVRQVGYTVENVFENLDPLDWIESTWACYLDIIKNPAKDPSTLNNVLGRTWQVLPGPANPENTNLWNPKGVRFCPGMLKYIPVASILVLDLKKYLREQCQQILNPPAGVEPCTCPQYYKGGIMQDKTSFWIKGVPLAMKASLYNGYKGYQYMITNSIPYMNVLSSLWQTILFFFPASFQTEEVLNVFNPVFAGAGMGLNANAFCIVLHLWSISVVGVVIVVFVLFLVAFTPFLAALANFAIVLLYRLIIDPTIRQGEMLGARDLDPDAVMIEPLQDDDFSNIRFDNGPVDLGPERPPTVLDRAYNMATSVVDYTGRTLDDIERTIKREKEKNEQPQSNLQESIQTQLLTQRTNRRHSDAEEGVP